jgi:hypothetical protein
VQGGTLHVQNAKGLSDRMVRNLSAALYYARRGRPVFFCYDVGPEGQCSCRKGPQCEHPGKHPRWERGTLEHGHLDATTDEGLIRRWWGKWPYANVAAPVLPGEMVLDVDPKHGGFESLRNLEAEYGPIHASVMARTGSGGLHDYLGLPPGAEVKTDTTGNKLGPGLDVKVNGYVLVPPSRTDKGDYRWLHGELGTTPLSDAPEWLIVLLREPPKASRRKGENSPRRPVPTALDDSPIPAGEGNQALTSIAGRLHDGTRSLAELEAALAEVNARRCLRPLPDSEIAKIARSIHGQEPCKASVDVWPEVLAALDLIEADVWDRPERWSGKSGNSQWKIKYALIDAARQYGRMIPTGVRVSLSRRDLAERAGVSLSTAQRNIPKMKKAGQIRTDNLNRHHDEAGAFVLPFAERSNSVHSPTTTESLRTTELTSVPDLSVLKKLRHAAPGVWRVGPPSGMATLALLRSGGTLSNEQLTSMLGISRARNLRRRGGVLERMESVGMVVCSENSVSLTPRWNDALEQAREEGREEQAEMRQRRLHQAQQRAYRLKERGTEP